METETHILIVDDEKGMCDYMQYFLTEEGYTVDHAYSSNEALQRMEHIPYDIIFTDIRMPGMDGLDMLKRIKEHNPDITVIVMTAYPSAEYELKAVNYGAYQYLRKPLEDPDAVLNTVKELRRPD